jgi:hypothetical protein
MSTNYEYRKNDYHQNNYHHQQQQQQQHHHQKTPSPSHANRIIQLDAEFDQNLASMKKYIINLKDRKRSFNQNLIINLQ